jgi:hypothetical protein
LFIAVLLLISAVALLTTTPSSAEEYSIDVKAFLSIRPTTIGVGQEGLINMWISPAPSANRVYHDMKITITKPDGHQDVYPLDTYVADGTMWMPFIPDQVGVWEFKLEYSGEYFAPGRYLNGKIIDDTSGGTVYADGATIKPAPTQTQKVIVQEEVVPSLPAQNFPRNDYWTRPVHEENREWWPYIGDYPWFGPGTNSIWDELYPGTNPAYNSEYGFVAWVSGPESGHIVWKRQYAFSGLMGGDPGGESHVGPPLSSWNMKPSLIVGGRAYHSYSKVATDGPGSQTYWECYDIRTGKVYWERALYTGESAPNLIEYSTASPEVEGADGNPNAPLLLSISNGYLRKYNVLTGAMTANISIAPMTGTGGTYYKNGYVLGIQDLGADAGADRYRLINWTTLGTSANFASRVVSNTTYARSALPTNQLTDWNVGIGCTLGTISGGGMYMGQNITAYDLKTGRELWTKTIDDPPFSSTACVADSGQIAILSAKGSYVAFDLQTGKETWRTRTLDYPWDASGWGSYSITSAYGQLYWVAQTGVYAIDWKNGDINWKFEKEAPPFETPFINTEGQTVYPFNAPGLCADGKLYLYSSEHTPDAPFYRGQPVVCIDVFTGKEVWSVGGLNGDNNMRRAQLDMAVADGYLTVGARDGYMYTFGRGESATTISASQAPLALGQKALITGTVLDLSPAQYGTPCVSKDSMDAVMAHIHVQTPINGVLGDKEIAGVPVYLYAVDPNGKNIEIGVVISDGYSGTFGFDKWVPEVSGLYTVTATFLGDESYGISSATTYLTVSDTATTSNNSSTDSNSNTILIAIIGAAIAIIVVMILCFLIFRKK